MTYLVRGSPTYDFVGEESFDQIEATADKILAEIGIEFRDDPETVRLFTAAGGKPPIFRARPITSALNPA